MPERGRLLRFALAWTLLFVPMQALRAGPVGAWWIERATAAPSAALIGWLRPSDGVLAQGPRLVWPGGRLSLQAGCDGLELLALLAAALLAAPLPWRRRVTLLPTMLLLVWVLNQGRLLALYASFRHWPDGFDALHVVVAPLLMLGLAGAWLLPRLGAPR